MKTPFLTCLFRRILPAVLCYGLLSATASFAEPLQLSLKVAAEYNDNIDETVSDREAVWITYVIPSLSGGRSAAHWQGSFDYHLEYRHYSSQNRDDELNHFLLGHLSIQPVRERFFIDIANSYSRIAIDDINEVQGQNIFNRQTNQNLLTVSPYVVLPITGKTSLKAGYRYSRQDYSSDDAAGWQNHLIFFETSTIVSRRSTLLAGLQSAITLPVDEDRYSRLTGYLGYQYEYADQCRVLLRGGYSLLHFADEPNEEAPYWEVGIDHRRGRNTFSLNSGVQYQADVNNAFSESRYIRSRWQRELDHSIFGLSGGYARIHDQGTERALYDISNAGMDLTQRLTDKLTCRAGIQFIHYGDDRDRPYRLLAGGVLTYSWTKNLTASAEYQWIANREELSSSENVAYTNRYTVSLRKTW